MDPFIPFSGDYDMLIKLGSRHKVISLPDADVLYRKHDQNFSDQYEVGRGEVEAMVSRYQSFAKAKGDQKLLRDVARLLRRPRRVFSAQAFDRARRSLHAGRYKEFVRHLLNASWYSPVFVGRSVLCWAIARAGHRSG